MKQAVKSVLILTLVLSMVCMLAACGEDISGHYTLVKVTMGTQVYTQEQLNEMAGSTDKMFLELNSDGTGLMQMLGTSAKMQWKDGQIWSEDSGTKVPFTVEGDTLTLNLSGAIYVFQK